MDSDLDGFSGFWMDPQDLDGFSGWMILDEFSGFDDLDGSGKPNPLLAALGSGVRFTSGITWVDRLTEPTHRHSDS